ncbi:MAG: ABC transporter substrate-binding protein [Cyclobacteriaceae bacterium]|nr:ABC transporter substrate-binding protein [Cyclobacteriaceae bacterium]
MRPRHNFHILPIICLFMVAISCKTGTSTSEEETTTVNTTGVSETEIVIGSWGPMTGPAALWGTIIKGTDAYFKMINDEGGINGRKIRFVYKDDAFDPSKTVPAVRELVQNNEIFAVAGGIGTACNMAVFDFMKENGVPWVSPMSGATYWTQPVSPHIFTTFPLYFDEGQVMAEIAINDHQIKKVGIVYMNDDFGKSGLVGVKSILEKNNMEFVAAVPVETSDSDLSSHVAKLKDAGAEAVFLWTLPRQAAIILGSSAVIDYKPEWFASLVLSDMTLMHQITKGLWEGVYYTSAATTQIDDESNASMMKYKAAFEKYYPEDRWGIFAAFGFMLIEPLVEGIKAAGPELSRESLLSAMEKINNFNGTSGLPFSFSATNHLGSRSMVVMQCKSATEAEKVSEVVSGSADIDKLLEMLHAN